MTATRSLRRVRAAAARLTLLGVPANLPAMRVHRRLTAAICQVLIGLLLFTQAAFATRPCMDASMSAASAIAAADEHSCCETVVSEANLCVMKCTDGDKVSAHMELVIPLPTDQPVLILAALNDAGARRSRPALDTAAHDPPKTIRFCSFLI